jgi:hypothetical protein
MDELAKLEGLRKAAFHVVEEVKVQGNDSNPFPAIFRRPLD